MDTLVEACVFVLSCSSFCYVPNIRNTTSAAVVASLTFGTYFSLAGSANIDDNDVDSRQASHRHQNITSYFSHEDDGSSSPSGGEKWEKKQETPKIEAPE